MKIKVLFFASIREIVGVPEMTVEIPGGTGIGDLIERLGETVPALLSVDDMMISVNGRYAQQEDILDEGDVVAILPPVSGG